MTLWFYDIFKNKSLSTLNRKGMNLELRTISQFVNNQVNLIFLSSCVTHKYMHMQELDFVTLLPFQCHESCHTFNVINHRSKSSCFYFCFILSNKANKRQK